MSVGRGDNRSDDGIDHSMSEWGLASLSSTARVFGRSVPWVKDQIIRGHLQAVVKDGRPYVIRASAEALARELRDDAVIAQR